MSAPMNLAPFQLRNLADALDAMTKIQRNHHVDLCAYSPIDVRVGETVVRVTWNDEAEEYQIDDRNGT